MRRRGPVPAFLLVWLLALGLACLPAVERAELAWLDTAFGLLRGQPAPAREVVLVAFDEASLRASGKPFALLHDDLAAVLDAVRLGGARAVALDLVLPAEDYASLQPGAARRLALALGQVRARVPLVLGQVPGRPDSDSDTARLYAAMAGAAGRASLLVPADADGVLRRLGPDAATTLAGRLVERLGVPARAGMVDFSIGAPFSYLPTARVKALLEAGDTGALRRHFGAKVVLVGAVLPDHDRQRLPVALAGWEPGVAVPGLVFQSQAVRSLLGGRTIATPPGLGAAAALALLLLTWRRRLALAVAIGLLAMTGAVAAALVLLAQGVHLPLAPGVLALAGGLAWLAGSALHEHRAERARMRAIFAGYVSPAILDTILSGALRDGLPPRRRHIAFLFADIRGFTGLCAANPPEAVIAFLNRYYEAITVPLHRHGGTIDKFSGDGIMAFFGAPRHSDNPERDALQAALGMLDALRTLNASLRAEGQAPVRIGIGVAAGEAVLGNVGSAARHDYTATGAPAAFAAHIQQHCKGTPYTLLVERAAFDAAGDIGAAFDRLDAQLDKHGVVALAGLREAP